MPKYGGVRRSWIELHYQHKAQCNSLSAAWMIFISGGMKIAWGIYEQPLVRSQNSNIGQIHFIISWFIGVIIGAQFATMFVQRFSKNVANYTSSALVLIGGILYVALPNQCIAILMGRYIDGGAFGIAIIQAISTGGEVSIRHLRGTVMTSERICIWTGICIQLSYSTIFLDKVNATSIFISDDQFHGAVSIVLGFFALIFTVGFPIESPIYLQLNHRDSQSLNSIMRLQSRSHPTNEVFEIFNDNRLWISENASQSFRDEIQNGCVAFAKLAFLRSLVSLTLSLPFHWAFVLASKIAFDSSILLIFYGLAGLLGSLLSLFFMDCQGRRMTSASSLCLGGTLLLAIGGIFLEFEVNIGLAPQMKVITILLLAYQFINAFTFAPATTIYMSEAFALPLKTPFISGVIVVENLVQVITCVLVFSVTLNYAAFFFTIGVLNWIACFVVMFWLPETKRMTLRESNHEFSKLSTSRCGN